MRIGSPRLGALPLVAALVLATVGVSASVVHVIWQGATMANSAVVAADLSAQIADTVRKELGQTVGAARSTWGAIRTVLAEKVIASREEDKREFLFLSQMQAQPLMSAITYAWADNSLFSARKLGDGAIEMTEVKPEAGGLVRRSDRYKVFPGGTEFEARAFEATTVAVSAADWFRQALTASEPRLIDLASPFDPGRAMLAYVGAVEVDLEKDGVLAILIDHARFSRFLSTLSVGQGRGAAFILNRRLDTIASPDPGADEISPPLGYAHSKLAVARTALQQHLAGSRVSNAIETAVLNHEGERLSVSVSALNLLDWYLVVAIPEEFFVGIFAETASRLAWLIGGLALALTVLAVFAAHRLLSRPIMTIAEDAARIESFAFRHVVERPSHLKELSALSSILVRTSRALAAFQKYMPVDLVRQLIATGVEARPGGAIRPITVMFADLKGFTALSEEKGAGIVQVISGFFQIGSREIAAQGGIVDKFIGDAIMAFWNAPTERSDHAVAACQAALAIRAGLEAAGREAGAAALGVRIGINTGDAVVGNIGSEDRLNYTAMGDTVNVASRLEGLNRALGTTILLGAETRRQAGDAVIVREIDRFALYGRNAGTVVFELVAMAGDTTRPQWIADYERGLQAYRERRFVEAGAALRQVLAAVSDDAPAQRLLKLCERHTAAPPPPDWDGVSHMADK